MATQTVSENYVVGYFLDHAANLSLEDEAMCFMHKRLVGRRSTPKPDIVSLGFHRHNEDASLMVTAGYITHADGNIDDTYYVVDIKAVDPDFVIFKVANDGSLNEFRRTANGDYRYTCSLNHEWAGKRLDWIAQQCVDDDAYFILTGAPRPIATR